MKKLLALIVALIILAPNNLVQASATYDNSLSFVDSCGTSSSQSFTVGTLTNGRMIVQFYTDNFSLTNPLDSASFNSVAMTLVSSTQLGLGGVFTYTLANPDSGTHTLAASKAGGRLCGGAVITYAGMSQTAALDAAGSFSTGSGTTHSETVTTSNDHAVALLFDQNGSGTATAGIGTLRAADVYGVLIDSIDVTPAAATTLRADFSAASYLGLIQSWVTATSTDTTPTQPQPYSYGSIAIGGGMGMSF